MFAVLIRLGGDAGWPGGQRLWRWRGALDRLVGGPGLRRGRRDPALLALGDALDFWRVTAVTLDRRLALRAEMKVPGDAVLEFAITPAGDTAARCILTQRARFRPRGLLGLAYWYTLLPLHRVVFARMVDGVRRAAEARVPDAARERLKAS